MFYDIFEKMFYLQFILYVQFKSRIKIKNFKINSNIILDMDFKLEFFL